MAKDPACLFYWENWAGGTSTFTRHLKGCYMDLMNAQFNNGPLTLDEVKTVLASDFGSAWPTLQKKFCVTPGGLFFNERLQREMDKRAAYTKSRRENLESKTSKHMDNHMGIGIGNGIEVGRGKEGAGRKPPPDAMRDQMHIDWETWGTLIVDDGDQYWQGMRGRKVSREEMDAFISVAARNGWLMETAQIFRVALRGFDLKKGTSSTVRKAKAFDL